MEEIRKWNKADSINQMKGNKKSNTEYSRTKKD